MSDPMNPVKEREREEEVIIRLRRISVRDKGGSNRVNPSCPESTAHTLWLRN